VTNKQRVLKRHPKAVSWQSPSGRWWISIGDWAGRDISKGMALTPAAAWASAAKGLRK